MSRVTKAVFLDRDGVLCEAIVRNGKPYPPDTFAALRMVPGASDACAYLKAAGFLLICVTNQPDIARGRVSLAAVNAINARLHGKLGLDEIRTCPHDDVDACECRKPSPGLLIAASRDCGIDLSRSYMVGDRWRDVECGQAAGCKTVFINHGYAEKQPEQPDFVCSSLLDASLWILSQEPVEVALLENCVKTMQSMAGARWN